MSLSLRAIGEQLRLGRWPAPPASGLHEMGDAIIAGLDATTLVEAIEWEIREEAAYRGVCNDSQSIARAWEALRENIEEDRDLIEAIRAALVATGSLSPIDRSTPLPELITALFAT